MFYVINENGEYWSDEFYWSSKFESARLFTNQEAAQAFAERFVRYTVRVKQYC